MVRRGRPRLQLGLTCEFGQLGTFMHEGPEQLFRPL
ncbi:MAG: hypothetical protein JWM25_1700, partial [Thermoleophilia bacterium]|nr:hypothetical protein [Thermoleophilia bacterium]